MACAGRDDGGANGEMVRTPAQWRRTGNSLAQRPARAQRQVPVPILLGTLRTYRPTIARSPTELQLNSVTTISTPNYHWSLVQQPCSNPGESPGYLGKAAWQGDRYLQGVCTLRKPPASYLSASMRPRRWFEPSIAHPRRFRRERRSVSVGDLRANAAGEKVRRRVESSSADPGRGSPGR